MKKEEIFVKELNPDALAQRISKVLIDAGVRKPITDNRKHDVPLLNGYRRWFDDVLSNMLGEQQL